jgi:hypothetical protein
MNAFPGYPKKEIGLSPTNGKFTLGRSRWKEILQKIKERVINGILILHRVLGSFPQILARGGDCVCITAATSTSNMYKLIRGPRPR